jgi:IS1 family transposase
MPPTHRRPRTVDTSQHFCPHTGCRYRGWLGLGNLRANGHPSGGLWRQFQCTSCEGYFLETHGTIFHGKQVAVELIVHVLACLAEGLGIRATARVFEVDPNTVLRWLVEAAEQLTAFSACFLCDVHVNQVQLDELYAVLREVKDGTLSEDEAIKRLERSRHWVWTAIDPESKLVLAIEIGPRTLVMAQCVVHRVVQKLAASCVPLWLTDGNRDYTMAFLAHFGFWHQPERKRAQGPAPKPRWLPLPELLYAQVVKSYRRRRLVAVKPRVVFGTLEAIEQVLAVCGWKINTAFVERLNLDIRQRVAAVGRRVNTLCQGEDGMQHQLALFHTYYNFVLPHRSLRQALPESEPLNGAGSAKQWQPCTPAMAAGLTKHVWTLKEVLMFRVPPWPQPHAV